MDEKLIREWQAALRSGDYKKGRRQLRSGDDCFCVVGVLCDITGEVEWDEFNRAHFGPHRSNVQMPYGLATKLGVRASLSFSPAFDGIDALTILNDDTDMTFEELADLLERFIEGDFTFTEASGHVKPNYGII